jgi:hypothetical protein
MRIERAPATRRLCPLLVCHAFNALLHRTQYRIIETLTNNCESRALRA